MLVSGVDVRGLSVEEARQLIFELEHHVRSEEASLTPAELREHLREMPDQLRCEARRKLAWKFRCEIDELVMDYVIRHGDWNDDDAYELCGDDEGGVDENRVYAEFEDEIDRLRSELIAEIFTY